MPTPETAPDAAKARASIQDFGLLVMVLILYAVGAYNVFRGFRNTTLNDIQDARLSRLEAAVFKPVAARGEGK